MIHDDGQDEIDQYEARDERLRLKENLIKWKLVSDIDWRRDHSAASKFILRLFQYKEDYDSWWRNESKKPKVFKTMQLLNGPNGFALLKAMLAKHDEQG